MADFKSVSISAYAYEVAKREADKQKRSVANYIQKLITDAADEVAKR